MSGSDSMLAAPRDVREAAGASAVDHAARSVHHFAQAMKAAAEGDLWGYFDEMARSQVESARALAALDALDEARRAVWVERMSARVGA